jgi:hypothetical protein
MSPMNLSPINSLVTWTNRRTYGGYGRRGMVCLSLSVTWTTGEFRRVWKLVPFFSFPLFPFPSRSHFYFSRHHIGRTPTTLPDPETNTAGLHRPSQPLSPALVSLASKFIRVEVTRPPRYRFTRGPMASKFIGTPTNLLATWPEMSCRARPP